MGLNLEMNLLAGIEHEYRRVFFGNCEVVYDDENIVYEIVDHREFEWKPGSKKARKFVPLNYNSIVRKFTWKHSLKYTNSQTHSLKGYQGQI